MNKPTLIAFLPPIGGLPKTDDFFNYHRDLINTGDIVYSTAVSVLCAGSNHMAWNFSATAEVVNENFSHVIWAIPCRIATPPFDNDGFPYEFATNFIESLRIPFTSITESIQSKSFDYDSDFHNRLSPKVCRYLKAIAEKSRIVGTRGDFSAEVLSKLGISNVEPIGCPSLYLNGPRLQQALLKKKPFSDVKNIALGYSNYQRNSWSQIGSYMIAAAKYSCYFVEQTSNIVPKLLYYPNKISREDLVNSFEHYGSLAPLITLLRRHKLRYFTNYANWKNFLSGMDFVFGARMHGLTPSIHAGVPAHFIAHDSRVREMCEFFQLPFSEEIELSKCSSEVNIEKLYEATDYDNATKVYPTKFHRFLNFLRANSIPPQCDAAFQISDELDYSASPGVEIELDPFRDTPGAVEIIIEHIVQLMENCPQLQNLSDSRLREILHK